MIQIYTNPMIQEVVPEVKPEFPYWITSAVSYGPSVLQLNCSDGKLLRVIRQAKPSLNLFGIDGSEVLISQAKKQSHSEIQYSTQDIRAFILGMTFDLIFIADNELSRVITSDDFFSLIRCIKAHLKPSGRLMIDINTPSMSLLQSKPDEYRTLGTAPDPKTGEMCTVRESARYDNALQIMFVKWFYFAPNGKLHNSEEFCARLYFPQELDELLLMNGFVIEKKYGSYLKTPFSSNSTKQLVVASALT